MSAIANARSIDDAKLAQLQGWQGRTETQHDVLVAAPVAALSATLGRDDAPPESGTMLPPPWHWVFFQPHVPQSQIGADGHPKRGGFLPPVPLPRRMWAAGRLQWEAGSELRVGQQIDRQSTIVSVQHKLGRSGELMFVQVQHDYRNDDGLALSETQDLVYRAAARAGEKPPPPQKPPLAGQATWSRTITPDPVLLFRYSALTFNGHRIHYDRPYAIQQEGYPGLVVHGPLIATLLVDLLRRSVPGVQLASFEFRAVRPTFDTHAFSVHGKPQDDGRTVDLWAQDHEGWLTMKASATLA